MRKTFTEQLNSIMGLHGKVLVAGGRLQGWPSVRRWTPLAPAGSKTDPSPDTADAGGAYVIKYLRKGKKHCAGVVRGRGKKKCERNSPAGTKVSEEGGRGGVPGTGAEIPLEKIMVEQAVPPAEEGAAERSSYELTATPIPLCHSGQGGGRRVGNKGVMSLGRREGGGKVVLVLSLFLTILP